MRTRIRSTKPRNWPNRRSVEGSRKIERAVWAKLFASSEDSQVLLEAFDPPRAALMAAPVFTGEGNSPFPSPSAANPRAYHPAQAPPAIPMATNSVERRGDDMIFLIHRCEPSSRHKGFSWHSSLLSPGRRRRGNLILRIQAMNIGPTIRVLCTPEQSPPFLQNFCTGFMALWRRRPQDGAGSVPEHQSAPHPP